MSACRIDHITETVDRHHRADDQPADPHAMSAQSAFHRLVHAIQLADCRAASCADRSGGKSLRLAVPAGLIAHRLVRPNPGIAAGQVEQHRRRHDRHPRHTHVEAEAVFFQITHYSARSSKPISTAAGQQQAVDFFHQILRFEQVRFPRPRCAATHIDPCRSPFRAEDDRAAGRACQILRIA